mmetsp:Transcript_62962/g.111833  ORF Transcript_62962/g.111833 Transcript_62962/m.111833 type:complete len:109 (+) Transcript_62962:166-492(+)
MEMKKTICAYMCTVFVCRLMLRSSLAQNLHWAALMLVEDGMSVLSFCMGLYYLHSSNGEPLALVAKCVNARAEGNLLAPWVAQPQQQHADGSHFTQTEQRIRLFSLAL